ncbi:type I polyketide synthase [Kitasatospora mediocidica]|uniref:type I polyketide synthase n=1 Tax=Kitasatospora mediocidica TaxID=58352 RepID=UPI000569DEE8|nr:type I polyketide synthase [Kitasatospora mediocidica]
MNTTAEHDYDDEDDGALVALVAMAGRFPGTASVERFWRHLVDGDELITRFPEAGDGGHVPAYGIFEEADRFDAAFFGYSPREALMLDPQHRVFLECCWEALERAGCDPARFAGQIGVYGGSGESSHAHRLREDPVLSRTVPGWELRMATAADFLTSRVSYKLGLTGPAVTVQTACSTSLVAVHLAVQALLAGECDLALAGGVTVQVPYALGGYTEGGVISQDGHCRAFDAKAGGTVGADGAGVVVLRRLADALADGDHIHAVLRATAVNNDGSDKIGFTAPSVSGQAAAVLAAHTLSGVDPATIGYLEAHGTGTPMGDPIEISALTQAFRAGTAEKGFCRIGSLKSNLGHTDTAAGVLGLMKAALVVEHGLIPPSLHFEEPNPEIDFDASPFTVATALTAWPKGPVPRRAGVNSLGIGGTNAHAVLEQPPTRAASAPETDRQLLVVSARTATALDQAVAGLGSRLADPRQTRPGEQLADVAWTLQTGRAQFAHRAFALGADHAQAAAALGSSARRAPVRGGPPAVGFLFPGQGGQHTGMAAELYDREPVFRASVDHCAELLSPALGVDLRTVLYPSGGPAGPDLQSMELAQPAVFTVEFALSELWRSWGVHPATVLGHSLGSYAAACVAGVLSLPDALAVVVERGRILGALPQGAMLAVALPEAELAALLPASLSLAAVNGPGQCVVSGPAEPVAGFGAELAAGGVDCRALHITSAAHSSLVEPAIADFTAWMGGIALRPPTLRWISDTTGRPVSAQEACDPAFWARHLRETVRFGAALDTLLVEPDQVLLEVGPSHTLSTLTRRHPRTGPGHTVLASLPHPSDETPARTALLNAAGGAWTAGVELDWTGLHHTPRRRAVLPGYPFQHARYRLASQAGEPTTATALPEAEPGFEPDVKLAFEPDVELAFERPDLAQEFSAARDEPERRLAAVFGEVLGIGEVGREDDFFELGGDSLIASRLVTQVHRAFGVKLAVRAVFRAPTVARLLPVIQEEENR